VQQHINMDISLNRRSVILTTCIILLSYCGCLAKKCEKINACSCKMDSGFVVDLSPISKTDNTP